ncbi:type II toxin-antitoxin system RelE/ParE family toxin [Reichenbachiella versicolor]|uniref:type II toxin-antitoxin system RelE/ParE family toxin n=1 Tax=Reichenbachiella versicolor TaxID=1821036 RepID=UPI0013A56DD5|nr:type II toxin-antitoxin system RelE/ParE family toxin [Reichenbachiella versicolor]
MFTNKPSDIQVRISSSLNSLVDEEEKTKILIGHLIQGEKSGIANAEELRDLKDMIKFIGDVSISRQALDDLRGLWCHIKERSGAEIATNAVKEIVSKIQNICKDESIGQPMNYIREFYRFSSIGEYLLFYLEGEIEIIRILPQSIVVIESRGI